MQIFEPKISKKPEFTTFVRFDRTGATHEPQIIEEPYQETYQDTPNAPEKSFDLELAKQTIIENIEKMERDLGIKFYPFIKRYASYAAEFITSKFAGMMAGSEFAVAFNHPVKELLGLINERLGRLGQYAVNICGWGTELGFMLVRSIGTSLLAYQNKGVPLAEGLKSFGKSLLSGAAIPTAFIKVGKFLLDKILSIFSIEQNPFINTIKSAAAWYGALKIIPRAEKIIEPYYDDFSSKDLPAKIFNTVAAAMQSVLKKIPFLYGVKEKFA